MDRGSRSQASLGDGSSTPLHTAPSRHHNHYRAPSREPGAPALPTTGPNQSDSQRCGSEAILHVADETTNSREKTTWFSAKRLFSVRGTVPSLPCPHSKETEVPWKHLAGFHPHEAGKEPPRQFLLFLVPDIAMGQLHSWPQCHMSTSLRKADRAPGPEAAARRSPARLSPSADPFPAPETEEESSPSHLPG